MKSEFHASTHHTTLSTILRDTNHLVVLFTSLHRNQIMKIVFAASILSLLLRESDSFSIGSPSRIVAVHHNNEKDESTTATTTTRSKRQVFQNMGQVVLERSDTLRSAGFYDRKSDDHLDPLVAGAKTNIILFCLALGYKWYRSIFINKVGEYHRDCKY